MTNCGTNSTLEMIGIVADSLGELLNNVVFVGGASVVFLVPKTTYSEIRSTEDIDVIVDIATTNDYYKFRDELRILGFIDDTDGPLCRFKEPTKMIKVDVMPLDESVLGFSNRWYKQAIKNAHSFELSSGKVIKYCSLPYFLGCKFEAFINRNNRDYFGRDFEDICFILEKAENVEITLHDLIDQDLKKYISSKFHDLLNDQDMLNFVTGVISDPKQFDVVIAKMKFISRL